MTESYGRKNLDEKKHFFLSLLTSSLLTNGIATLDELEATPLVLVYGIHKVTFNGCYLPPYMVGDLVSAKQ